MIEKLTDQEKSKIKDFMDIYRNYLNPNQNDEIDTIIDYIIDSLIRVYLEYKNVIPFVSVEDDNYGYYIIKPVDGKYSLLDYLINTVIQNLDSILLVEDRMCCNYNLLKKKMFINRKNVMSLNPSVFDTMKGTIDRKRYLELYYKKTLYHEIGHMLHYRINNITERTVYVPADYLSLSEFPPLKKRMSLNAKKAEMERRKAIVKERAKEKIKRRIDLYKKLSNKYDVLRVEEIDDCDIEVERPNVKYEEIMLPPMLYFNPVEEAFTECDAQVYSGLFENDIFEIEGTGNLDCFYLPIDDEHVLMTYSPSAYSFSSSIGFALKGCVSKISYFRTLFLGKNDFFLEFLGEYEFLPVSLFSNRLISADKGKMDEVQPLLDDIVNIRKIKGKSLNNLNIYFPLVYRDGKWMYYTDTIDIEPPNNLKLQLKKKEDNK